MKRKASSLVEEGISFFDELRQRHSLCLKV